MLVLSLWWADRDLYPYGWAWFHHDIGLPVHVVPDFDGPGEGNTGFMLMDEGGLPVVQWGGGLRDVDLFVGKVLRYSFNADDLFVWVQDTTKQEHLLRLTDGENGVVRLEMMDKADCSSCTSVAIPSDLRLLFAVKSARNRALAIAIVLFFIALIPSRRKAVDPDIGARVP